MSGLATGAGKIILGLRGMLVCEDACSRGFRNNGDYLNSRHGGLSEKTWVVVLLFYYKINRKIISAFVVFPK
jgi:hypothetical protein